MENLPSPEDFCLKVGLYEPFRYEMEQARELYALEDFRGPLDAFCEGCGRESVFVTTAPPQPGAVQTGPGYIAPRVSRPQKGGIHLLEFACTREHEHRLVFCFLFKPTRDSDGGVRGGAVAKIGQHPSLADLSSADIQKYRKHFPQDYEELNRAVGLFAHGIGIGSFVYLRRIWERLVEKAHQEEAKTPGWDEEAYRRARVHERIPLLRDRLPDFLTENVELYAILSKGVHELSEGDCKAHFPIVRTGIELILDERLERIEKAAKIAAAKKAIGDAHGKLKGGE